MRYLFYTVLFFIVATVIKIDLTEGTVPLAAFSTEQEQHCNEQISVKYTSVVTVPGDSVQSLLATYSSDVELSMPEKMAHFYELNPHLQKQAIVPGETIKLPIYKQNKDHCTK